MFSHSTAEGGKFICAHLESEFNKCTYGQNLAQFGIHKGVMYTSNIYPVHLNLDFCV